ncbi:MAG UNVERIFIED_CONTAM: GtrA family protein [Anaerolineae bacterium]|jgi:putative flippase GtrA
MNQAQSMLNPLRIPDFFIVRVASRFGSKSREVERFLRFVVVGGIGAIVDFSTLIILQSTILKPLPPAENIKVIAATTAAFVAAVLSNFMWNRFWTYPDSRSRSFRRQIAQFTLINAIGWIMRTIFIERTYQRIGLVATVYVVSVMGLWGTTLEQTPETINQIGTLVAQLMAIGFVMIWNFFANRYWTYNDVE